MTGHELVELYDSIVANDLYPVSDTVSTFKLLMLNNAARRVFRKLKIDTKAVPLTYVTGQTRYPLSSLITPLVEVSRVVANTIEQTKTNVVANKGWTQTYGWIDIYMDQNNGDLIYLDGFQGPRPIVDTGTTITDIPDECLYPIVQWAIVDACGSQEEDPTQMIRLSSMDKRADAVVTKLALYGASVAFPVF